MTTPDQPKNGARATGAPRPTTEQSSTDTPSQPAPPRAPEGADRVSQANPLPPRPLPRTGPAQSQTPPVRPQNPANGGAPTQASPVVPPTSGLPQRTPPPPAAPQGTGPQGRPQVQPPTQANRVAPPTQQAQQANKPATTSDRGVTGDDRLVASHDAPPRRAEHPQAPEAKDAQPTKPAATDAGKNGNPAAKSPPWQRGPQNEPQSNLHRPGESPVAGRPPARPPRVAEGTAGVTTAAGAAGVEAAKNARREAAKTKAAAIDGPTRKVARPELAKDMPDLSEVRHPLPDAAGAGVQKAAPVAVAAGVASQGAAADGTPLRATVQVRKIDPWSTLKVSLVISVALFFVWMVAVGLLYVVLDGMGVWDRLNNAFTDIVSESGSGGLVSGGQVFGYAAAIGLINVVLFTALATIGSFIYNQCSDLVGGVQVTLADPD